VNRRHCLTLLLAVLVTVLARGSVAVGQTETEPVQCWIENQTPSVAQGQPAHYVVRLSGGLGTYNVVMDFGDGWWEQNTYGTQAPFDHIFGSAGNFTQTASASGAGSQTTCFTSTSVY
jgi:hypothetical protein